MKDKYKIEDIIKKYRDKRIVIVGNGHYAMTHNFDNYNEKAGEECHIWTVNGGYMIHSSSELDFRADDLKHTQHNARKKFTADQNKFYNVNLINPPIPVIVSKKYPGFPSMVEFPLEAAIKVIFSQRPARKYFAETPSYMVLFAILCGVKQIDFFGTDYIGDDRLEARACLEYWCGFANGLGIITTASPNSEFLRTTFYKTHIGERTVQIENFYGYIKETLPKSLLGAA